MDYLKKSVIYFAFISLLLLISCIYPATRKSFVYTGYYHPPLNDSDYIQLIFDGEKDLKYEEIGIIEIRDAWSSPTFDEVVGEAKQIAREVGADCIIFMNKSSSIHGNDDDVYALRQYFFKAVRMKKG